jgi:hypothetical protein
MWLKRSLGPSGGPVGQYRLQSYTAQSITLMIDALSAATWSVYPQVALQ